MRRELSKSNKLRKEKYNNSITPYISRRKGEQCDPLHWEVRAASPTIKISTHIIQEYSKGLLLERNITARRRTHVETRLQNIVNHEEEV